MVGNLIKFISRAGSSNVSFLVGADGIVADEIPGKVRKNPIGHATDKCDHGLRRVIQDPESTFNPSNS